MLTYYSNEAYMMIERARDLYAERLGKSNKLSPSLLGMIKATINDLLGIAHKANELGYRDGWERAVWSRRAYPVIHWDRYDKLPYIMDMVGRTPLNTYVIMLRDTCYILVVQHGEILGKYDNIKDAMAVASKHLKEGVDQILGINNNV